VPQCILVVNSDFANHPKGEVGNGASLSIGRTSPSSAGSGSTRHAIHRPNVIVTKVLTQIRRVRQQCHQYHSACARRLYVVCHDPDGYAIRCAYRHRVHLYIPDTVGATGRVTGGLRVLADRRGLG